MIDNTTKQELFEHFKEMPSEVQNLIRDFDLNKELETIQETKPLQEGQKMAIQNEIVLIFLGLSDVVSLTINIRNSAQISRERAEKISTAIQQNILMPHIDILEKVFDTSEDKPRKSTEDIHRISSSQNKIEQKPLPQKTQQDLPQQTSNKLLPAKTPVKHSTQSPASIPQTPNVFAHKLSNPTIMKNEEEKVEVKNQSNEKPKHVDPYRESIE